MPLARQNEGKGLDGKRFKLMGLRHRRTALGRMWECT